MFDVSVEAEVLEQAPDKTLPFLRAIATRVEIRTALLACGYTEEEQARGWELLLQAVGHVPFAAPETDDHRARAAIVELDRWDKSGFRRIHAALGRLHPEQDAFVFSGLESGKGIEAILSVATLLDRLDALQQSPDRAATRDADTAAMATLARRGIDSAARARLRELVKIAQSAKTPIVTDSPPNTEARAAALRELHAWYKDWSETARAAIRRRDHLVLMGLAKRRTRKQLVTEPTASEAPSVSSLPVVTGAPVIAAAA